MHTFFLTGNDTGVGKTYIGCMLTKALLRNGIYCEARKPIESGCRETDQELLPEDALAYEAALNSRIPLDTINAYRFELPISPARAARLENRRISIRDLVKACATQKKCEVLLVEGAGGFYSPLCTDGLNSDLAIKLKASVLLVVPDRLGCINQTLLSVQAIERSGLNLFAVILNQHRMSRAGGMDNVEDLQHYVRSPLVVIPHETETSSDALELRRTSIQSLVDRIQKTV